MFFLAGCTSGSQSVIPQDTSQTEPTATQEPGYTLEEVAKHNTKTDCWLAIEGKVYDVSGFVGIHPGGEAILLGCGKEATELFNTKAGLGGGEGTPHAPSAIAQRENYYIGNLVD
ncbi:MAG: cytochrome b5 domain-containing protein [Candidatus Dojkabacteria bacterium]